MEVLFVLFSYLLGSIPTGLLLTKAFSKQDPRRIGSQNIGATNIYRAAGKALALMTLAGDSLKGFIPVSLAMASHLSELWVSLAAIAAFLGHLYPVFLSFKGGKGVATALGIFIAISPLAVLIDFFLFAGVLATWRIVSLGSLSAASFMPILLWMLTGSTTYVMMSICIGVLIFYRHRANIQRLIAGQENRIELRLRKGS
ncbi:MAG: glycerol-3-phosphate 1-O-acyltransferase PlsY [Proteobacteria bacterium]|nr:glycerol-3-phosphate 1-O-acyltransferase PlsY [Pseudomonadota bacterium]NIS71348.1 glycerol-3-phosphate 1-O-acyltransferase PlsY [Pseudomonadota bacterium]